MHENHGTELINILLVDDKTENLIALEKTLIPLKLQIFKATSGNEALKLMLDHDFAVVLLDVMMPVMDGYEVAKIMQQNEETKHIPIIFLTALSKSDQNYLHGMEVGAVDFLYKPIDPVIVLSKVKIFVDLHQVKNKLEKTVAALHEYQEKLEATNKQLKKLAEEDPLTDLANRRNFEIEFKRLLGIAQKSHYILSLIFIDVDNFKYINDKYGHATGDIVLITLSAHLNAAMKKYFSAANSAIAARLGGDEFAIIATSADNNLEKTEALVKHLLTSLQEPILCGGSLIRISISIGVACYPEAGTNVESLLRSADIALYYAKAAGKNQYRVCDPSLSVSENKEG